MTEFSTLLQQGNAWFFVPTAIALGALHGLEPGHSKTMMAAFIIAVRGTLAQALLLGLSATISHTGVVWLVAMAGLYFGQNWNAETTEPYFQVASAVVIMVLAVWMMWRTRQFQLAGDEGEAHHCHDHAHANDIRRRFANREVTTGQIIVFGLTGGLLPCPASITVLLLCLHLKKIALGVVLVLCFSVGLALTLTASGVLAALSVKHVSSHWSGFGSFAQKAPYFSGILIWAVGVYMGYSGLHGLGILR